MTSNRESRNTANEAFAVKPGRSNAMADPIGETRGLISASLVFALFATFVVSSCGGGQTSSMTMIKTTTTPPPPLLTISTSALPEGILGISYDQVVQASGGVAPFSWTLSGTLPHNLSLSPSNTNQEAITGTPDTPGTGAAFTVQVKDSAGQTATQSYSVPILLQSNSVMLTPANFDFSNQAIGSASTALTETLTNNATASLAITGITIGGDNASDFAQPITTCGATLGAGASCTINLQFVPTQSGPRIGTVIISDDAAGSPQVVNLSGTGLTAGANATLSSLSLPFGPELLNTTSSPWPVTLTNYGMVNLDISGIAVTGSFAETDNCVPTVAPLGTCTIQVTFSPTQSGDLSGTLSLSDNAPGPQTISLTGVGESNTPLLTGYCFATCGGRISSPAACPAGEPALTPGAVSVYPCGPVDGTVHVDLGRKCFISPPAHYGHCVTQ